MVTSFRYLGRVVLAADYYCLALVRNYSRARALWERITRILIRKRAEPRLSDFFFKAMVQVLLIFSAETWVFTPVWSGSWERYKTRWCGVLQGGSHCRKQTESGITPLRKCKWRMRYLRLWRITFGEGRTRPGSTLLRNWFWTCVGVRIGHQGHGWGCSGGRRRTST